MKLKELLCQVLPTSIHYSVDVDSDADATHADYRAVAAVKALCGRSWCHKEIDIEIVMKQQRDDNSANGLLTDVYIVMVHATSLGGDWSGRQIECHIPMQIEVDGYGDVFVRPNEDITVGYCFRATDRLGKEDAVSLPTHDTWLQHALGRHLVEQWLRWYGMMSITSITQSGD